MQIDHCRNGFPDAPAPASTIKGPAPIKAGLKAPSAPRCTHRAALHASLLAPNGPNRTLDTQRLLNLGHVKRYRWESMLMDTLKRTLFIHKDIHQRQTEQWDLPSYTCTRIAWPIYGTLTIAKTKLLNSKDTHLCRSVLNTLVSERVPSLRT